MYINRSKNCLLAFGRAQNTSGALTLTRITLLRRIIIVQYLAALARFLLFQGQPCRDSRAEQIYPIIEHLKNKDA
jgi:hypothetical protein